MIVHRNSKFAGAAVLLLLTTGLLFGQTAQIVGRVIDSTGAVVPATTITVANVKTGIERTTSSNEMGYFAVPLLPPGRYQLQAVKSGFKSFSRSGLALEVGQVARVDVSLEPGSLSEKITVVANVSQVQTENSSLGTVIGQTRVENLPLNGRNIFSMVQLIADVQPVSKSASGFASIDNGDTSTIRFNGGPQRGSEFAIDGNLNINPIATEITVVPALDTVQEVKVQSNGLKAEYGQTGGGLVDVVTKSGTNEFHGSLYEFLRNDALDARNAFATHRDPVTGRIKPVLRYNQYGGTFGGPVWIPKVYNGRNRTFFFAGYERWNWRTAGIRRSNVPTAQQREGDFSNTLDGAGHMIPLYDPATTAPNPNGNGYVRQPFSGNMIPPSHMDPVAQKILTYMPLPNTPPSNAYTNSLNFLSLTPTPVDQGVTDLRFDQKFSEVDSAFFRYTGTRNHKVAEGYGLGIADPSARTDERDNHNFLAREIHIFTPTTLNVVSAGVTRQLLDFRSPSTGLGLPGQLGFPSAIPGDMFPSISISGMLGLGAGYWSTGVRATYTADVGDSLTLIRGRHQFQVGIDNHIMQMNWGVLGYRSGEFSFTPSLTSNPQVPSGTGYGLATFLLGQVSGGRVDSLGQFSYSAWTSGLFFQDDMKVTPRLTLNLGLRYDLLSPPVERHNRASNFTPTILNPQTGMPGEMQYAGVTSPSNLVRWNRTNFGPRVGFAYAVTSDHKTAIRGAYGILYVPPEGQDSAQGFNALGFSVTTPFVAPGGGPYAAFRLQAGPDPSSILVPQGASGGPSAFRGQSVYAQEFNAPAGYVEQWNLTLQRQFLSSWVVSASYAGNRGINLFGADYDLNQLDPANYALGLGLQNMVPNPFYGQIATGALSGKTISRSQSLLPYPDYLGISTFANHGAASTYHSLAITLEKRYSSGLSALVSYTASKLIDDSLSMPVGSATSGGSFRIGRINRRLDRSVDETDVSQRLVGSAVYEIPFLKSSHGAVGALFGGWQLNGITTLQTGFPLAIRGGSNFTGIAWPDVITDPNVANPTRTQWFDTNAFRNPPNFVIGDVPRTMSYLRGPGLGTVDLSLFKRFTIREHASVEARWDVFNAFNRVNLGNPGTAFQAGSAGKNVSSTFGVINSALDARIMQLGLHLTF